MRRLIILWILVFMILVVIHEFWHFIAARKCWMKVSEFWIWMPPKLCNLRKDKQWTQFTLNWIPLWWFCSIEWEDPTDEQAFQKPNTFITAKLWKRLIVVFAGVAMNFLTAWIIFTWLFRNWIQPLSVSQVAEEKWSTSYLMASPTFLREQWFLTWETKSKVSVAYVNWNSYAEKIWLHVDDIITKIDGKDVSFDDFFEFQANWDKENHTLTVLRWDHEENFEFSCQNDECKFWFTPQEQYDVNIKFWFWWAMIAAFHEIWAEWNVTMDALGVLWKWLFSFKKWEMKEALNNLAWPVWAVRIWGMYYEMWWRSAYLAFAAIISLALAIFNILPIPALDWWRGLWMIIQSIFRIKPQKYFKYEWYVNGFCFYLLLLLGVILIVKDLIVFYWVNIPFIS